MTDGGARIPKQLPAKTWDFVDRTDERDEFEQRLQGDWEAGKPALIAVMGMQGVGKTTFAVEMGLRMAELFPDGQLFYELDGSQPGEAVSPGDVLASFLRAFGVSDIPNNEKERIALFRSETAGRRIVVVLDDADTVGQVLPLLTTAPGSAVVVTSRRHLDGFRFNGFTPMTLGAFDAAAAGELLAGMAGPLATEDPVALRTVCKVCEGLPLALRVLGVRLGGFGQSLSVQAEQLLDGKSFDVVELDGDRPVKRIYDLIYHDLSPEQARAYELASLHPGPDFSLPAAAALLGAAESEAAALLRALTRIHVLDQVGERFRFHSLVRDHAQDRALAAHSDSDRAAAVSRDVSWCLRRVIALDQVLSDRPRAESMRPLYDEIAPAYTGPDATERAMAELDREWPSLRAAVRAATDLGRPDVAWMLVAAMWFFGYQTGRHDAMIDLISLGASAARQAGELRAAWDMTHHLGSVHEARGELALARARFLEALPVARELGYARGEQSTLEWLGLVDDQLGEHVQALEWFAQSWAVVPRMVEPEQPRAYALLHMHSARVRVKLGDDERAHEDATTALTFFSSKETEGINVARTVHVLGKITLHRGEFADALQWLEQASRGFERYRMPVQLAAALDDLADLADRAGRPADAEAYRNRAAEIRAKRDEE